MLLDKLARNSSYVGRYPAFSPRSGKNALTRSHSDSVQQAEGARLTRWAGAA